MPTPRARCRAPPSPRPSPRESGRRRPPHARSLRQGASRQWRRPPRRPPPATARNGAAHPLWPCRAARRRRRQQPHKKKRRVKGRPVSSRADDASTPSRMPMAPQEREVAIGETITVGELAQRMAVKATEVIKMMMNMGAMATINQVIDQETAAIVVDEMGHTPKLQRERTDLEDQVCRASCRRGREVTARRRWSPSWATWTTARPRCWIISAAPAWRRARPAASPSTSAPISADAKGVITFLDTPGHAAFTAMRARGAKVTDIVVLVVAADDGVMPQTIEAIQHARAAEVPIVVAITKIDKPEADFGARAQRPVQARNHPRGMGRREHLRQVSAKTGEGVDELLDSILRAGRSAGTKAVARGPASGFVLESSLEKGRGPWPRCWCSRARSSWAISCWPVTSSAACAPCSTKTGKSRAGSRPVHAGAGAGPVGHAQRGR